MRDLRRAEKHIPADDPEREQKLRPLKRKVSHTKDDWRDADRARDHARHRLRVAPAMVTVEQTLALPYIRRTMRKVRDRLGGGRGEVRGGGCDCFHGLLRAATSQDAVISGANPALGLNEDPLSLASDESLAVSAGNALAEDIATWAWQVAWKAWAAQLATSAQQLERDGKSTDAIELQMAAEAYGALEK